MFGMWPIWAFIVGMHMKFARYNLLENSMKSMKTKLNLNSKNI